LILEAESTHIQMDRPSRIIELMMPSLISRPVVCNVICLVLLLTVASDAAESFEDSLKRLQTVNAGSTSQSQLKEAWDVVTGGGVERLTTVLGAMSDINPLSENWLRASVDAIAEHELQSSGELPVDVLEKFVLDSAKAPRARRTAYEWLTQVDPSASDRLLPAMLNDTSLEIRHDAVAQLIAEAKASQDDAGKLQKYQRALKSARSLEQMTQCVEQLQKFGETPNLATEFGYITSWKAIGPFDNMVGAGFDKVFPPETEIDFAKQYEGKSGSVKWVELSTTDQDQDLEKVGVVDLNEILVEGKGVAAYVVATFVSAKEQVLECRYGTVNATKLWVNGELLISKDIYHMGGEFDQYIGSSKFRKGENTILLKICQNEQTESWAKNWDFRLRVTDGLGGGIAQSVESK
jgi:hypothetical protein